MTTPASAAPEPAPPLAAVVVLAAGEGTRMRSSLPKVMHEIAGRPLIGHVLSAIGALAPAETVVVLGHARDVVAPYVASLSPAASAVVQDEQRGTGHAVRLALEALPSGLRGTVLVVAGDVPLLTSGTLGVLLVAHEAAGNVATVLSATLAEVAGLFESLVV